MPKRKVYSRTYVVAVLLIVAAQPRMSARIASQSMQPCCLQQ